MSSIFSLFGARLAILYTLCVVSFSNANIIDSADNYYPANLSNLKDNELKSSLQDLISDHTVLDYNTIYQAMDIIGLSSANYPCDNNSTHIPDIYSSYCWKPELNSQEDGGECGQYKKEGDCFNREHVWPKSWFGGFDNGQGAQTDLWELYPSDGYVNGLRGNLPLGPITCDEDATYISSNGSKIGPCDPKVVGKAVGGDYQGKCFEPANDLKGDIARSYFYLATCYFNKWSCCDNEGTDKSDIKPWMENILRGWHEQDPVNDTERKKNDVIFTQFQHNRNPFIDHPEWVEQISDF